jgi:hypothetical protein
MPSTFHTALSVALVMPVCLSQLCSEWHGAEMRNHNSLMDYPIANMGNAKDTVSLLRVHNKNVVCIPFWSVLSWPIRCKPPFSIHRELDTVSTW